ncbi:molybdopterin-dependent oxidoreductase, partial [Methylobacterium aerolatum]
MNDDDTTSPARRRFLVQGAAAAVGAVAGSGARAEQAAPPGVPDWMKAPGADTGSQPYGTPSRFEAGIIRNVPKGLKQYTSASTRTPLQDLDGILTPNGLFYERHHGGIPDIDPARHQLLIHGLVERPLVLTMEDIRRFPRVWTRS